MAIPNFFLVPRSPRVCFLWLKLPPTMAWKSSERGDELSGLFFLALLETCLKSCYIYILDIIVDRFERSEKRLWRLSWLGTAKRFLLQNSFFSLESEISRDQPNHDTHFPALFAGLKDKMCYCFCQCSLSLWPSHPWESCTLTCRAD